MKKSKYPYRKLCYLFKVFEILLYLSLVICTCLLAKYGVDYVTYTNCIILFIIIGYVIKLLFYMVYDDLWNRR